ncbi:CLC2B protein, partial [Penelope pileata]|nr:CLC2B protein [Penelope pileata]
WLGFQGNCYYFSETQSDWNISKENCSDHGASLAIIDNEEEMAFILRYAGQATHWIGLHRAEEEAHWTWTDGAAFTNWFELRGGGQCAYLNGDRISAALCHTKKKWICSRADDYILWKQKAYPE